MLIKRLFFILLMIFCDQCFAQNFQIQKCGTSFNAEWELRERMFNNRSKQTDLFNQRTSLAPNQTIYVPLKIHIVGDNNGIGYLRLDKLHQNICHTNNLYKNLPFDSDNDGIAESELKVVFYIASPINYINNSILYNSTNSSIVQYLMSMHRQTGYVNIFIGNNIPSSGMGTILAYYASNLDVIYCIKQTVIANSSTLAHELGHYFSLAHPHFGWDGIDYVNDPDVIATGCSPTYTPNGILSEKVARSGGTENCQLAADGFCDTNPDYNFGIFSVCTNNIQAADPDCISLEAPNTDNIMSYFNDACTNQFTPEQVKAIYLDLLSRGFHLNNPSSTSQLSEPPVISYPQHNNIAFYPESVNLRWTSVGGAVRYLVTINKTINNGQTLIGLEKEFVSNNSYAWVSLEPNREYTWTVKPLGVVDICHSFISTPATFRTADWVLAREITPAKEALSTKLYPNPATETVQLEIKSPGTEELKISIINSVGQIVLQQQRFLIEEGNNLIHLNVETLTTGLYLVQIQSIWGQKTYPLSILAK